MFFFAKKSEQVCESECRYREIERRETPFLNYLPFFFKHIEARIFSVKFAVNVLGCNKSKGKGHKI